MAITNGGPLRAPEPGAVSPISLTISGSFTNLQRVNSPIDCTGLTFTFEGYSSGSYDTCTIQGSALEYDSSSQRYVLGYLYFPNLNNYSTHSYLYVSPYIFTTAGSQTVTFTWEALSFSQVTATTSVNVISNAKGLYAFLADGRKVKIGTIEAPPPVTVTGVTTNIVIKAQSQNSGTAIITYTDGTSASYSFTVNLTGAGYPVTCNAPGTFTYNHYESIGVNFRALYYDYTEDGTTISDILMAVAGGGDN